MAFFRESAVVVIKQITSPSNCISFVVANDGNGIIHFGPSDFEVLTSPNNCLGCGAMKRVRRSPMPSDSTDIHSAPAFQHFVILMTDRSTGSQDTSGTGEVFIRTISNNGPNATFEGKVN